MIAASILRALGQAGDPRFRRVLGLGVLLAVALLAGMGAGFLTFAEWALPETITLPWIGTVGGIDLVLSVGSVLLVIALSVFLMVPVAALFTGFFLDRIVDAVEALHYPALSPARPVGLIEGISEAVRFFLLLVAVNAVGLVVYLVSGPFAPFVFWAVNGFLLGREYFTMVAQRRLGRDGARALRRRHAGAVWLTGALMAAPLSMPVLNLLVPVFGVAAFTHLFHALARGQSAG